MSEQLGAVEFAKLFGTSVDALPAACLDLIRTYDFRYQRFSGRIEEQLLLDVLTAIDSGTFSTAGPEGKGRWDRGWAENLERLQATGGDLAALVPDYIRPLQAVRFDGQYVMPRDPQFELHWYEVFQAWLFETYFKDADTIYEFGCGSGINLAALAQMYPKKRYIGLDWAPASKGIVDALGARYGWTMEGRVFDFFHPDEGLEIERGALVFTLGALEQTGRRWRAFLDYLLRFEPSLCVNIEPVVEWYTDDTLVDYAAKQFHTTRRYWEGFPAYLHELEQTGRATILKQKRSRFGSLYIEGYSQIIWRPIPPSGS